MALSDRQSVLKSGQLRVNYAEGLGAVECFDLRGIGTARDLGVSYDHVMATTAKLSREFYDRFGDKIVASDHDESLVIRCHVKGLMATAASKLLGRKKSPCCPVVKERDCLGDCRRPLLPCKYPVSPFSRPVGVDVPAGLHQGHAKLRPPPKPVLKPIPRRRTGSFSLVARDGPYPQF